MSVYHAYPDEFDSYKNGKPLSDAEIQEYVDRVVDNLVNTDAPFFYVACGNTLVIGVTHDDGQIVVFVGSEYQSFELEKPNMAQFVETDTSGDIHICHNCQCSYVRIENYCPNCGERWRT